MTVRVLIIDDSATMRAILRLLLEREDDIEVVGTACDAKEGRAQIKALDPDVVTLDVEMPGMNGLDFLDKIMTLRPTPVIIVSSLAGSGTDATVRALQAGAVDCYEKPNGRNANLTDGDGGRLATMVRHAAATQIRHRASVNAFVEQGPVILNAGRRIQNGLIAIGASTGGVEALHKLLRNFPADCPPTVIVQHINGQFAEAMARRLNEDCAPRVQLAETDMALRPGHIYIAPGNERHMTVRAGMGGAYTKLRQGDPVSGHRPSIDMLFDSVAHEFPGRAVGVLLTGMGADGAQGLLAMRQTGCPTIAQDQASCVVYGMPKVAVEIGAAEYVLGLTQIAGKALGLMAA